MAQKFFEQNDDDPAADFESETGREVRGAARLAADFELHRDGGGPRAYLENAQKCIPRYARHHSFSSPLLRVNSCSAKDNYRSLFSRFWVKFI